MSKLTIQPVAVCFGSVADDPGANPQGPLGSRSVRNAPDAVRVHDTRPINPSITQTASCIIMALELYLVFYSKA